MPLYSVQSIGATFPSGSQTSTTAVSGATYTPSSGTVNFANLPSEVTNQYPSTAPDFTTQTLWQAWVRVGFDASNSNNLVVRSVTEMAPISPVARGSGSGASVDDTDIPDTGTNNQSTTQAASRRAVKAYVDQETNEKMEYVIISASPEAVRQGDIARNGDNYYLRTGASTTANTSTDFTGSGWTPVSTSGGTAGDGIVEVDTVYPATSVSTTNTNILADTEWDIPDTGDDGYRIRINTGETFRLHTATELRALPVGTIGGTQGTSLGFLFGQAAEIRTIRFARTTANRLLVATGRSGGETFNLSVLQHRSRGVVSGGGSGDDAFDWATVGNTDTVPDSKFLTTTRTNPASGQFQVLAWDSNGNRVWHTLSTGGTPASGDFTFGYRAGASGAFTELANRVNGTAFDVAFATTGSGTQPVTFRVPSTHRITSLRGGSPGHRGTNEVTAWTEGTSGGFRTYTRTLVSSLNFSFEIIGGPA